jgi:hypothetical protein
LRLAWYISLLVSFLAATLLNTHPANGLAIQSKPLSIRYTGDGFDWQTLQTDKLKVSWYQGDANFGRSALNAASAGLESVSKLMPPDLTQPVEIFIYANVEDLHSTLPPGSESWVAGHADPALGVVMVVIEPGVEQAIQMEQRIPHELMHVMIYRHVGAGYKNIPAWLREGTATLAENYPNTDYDRVLANAVAKGSLIPLTDLCVSFPSDTSQAFLAYAESRSFTSYLRQTYGSTGLLDLAASYADGVECKRGTERALGVSLSSLEMDWRSIVLGQNNFLFILQNIAPYLTLLCLVLIIPLFGILTTLRKGSRDESGTSSRK